MGFNNVDDQGQEGMELAYDAWLQGTSGKKVVQKDRTGRTVKDLKLLSNAQPGKDLNLSIDLRMQYAAYRELKAVVQQHQANSGSAVVLDKRQNHLVLILQHLVLRGVKFHCCVLNFLKKLFFYLKFLIVLNIYYNPLEKILYYL